MPPALDSRLRGNDGHGGEEDAGWDSLLRTSRSAVLAVPTTAHFRHPREVGDPGDGAGPCRRPWIPAFAGMTGYGGEEEAGGDSSLRTCHSALLAVPATAHFRHPREGGDPGEGAGPCRRPWIPTFAGTTGYGGEEEAGEASLLRTRRPAVLAVPAAVHIRHPGESRGPGAMTLPEALDSGFRRNGGDRDRPCSCECRNLRCSGTVRSPRRLLLSQEHEGGQRLRLHQEIRLPFRHSRVGVHDGDGTVLWG